MNAPPAVLQTLYTFRILKTKRSRSCEAPRIRFSPRNASAVLDRAYVGMLGYWEHFVPLQRGFAECELP